MGDELKCRFECSSAFHVFKWNIQHCITSCQLNCFNNSVLVNYSELLIAIGFFFVHLLTELTPFILISYLKLIALFKERVPHKYVSFTYLLLSFEMALFKQKYHIYNITGRGNISVFHPPFNFLTQYISVSISV